MYNLNMAKHRISKWIDNSAGLMHIEMMVVHYAQGLGILDVELIKEFKNLKLNSKLKKDMSKKCKHIVSSYLWVFGAYELIRFINDINKKRNLLSENTRVKLKETLTIFSEIRVPLAKFQKMGKEETLYSGVVDSYFDPNKGLAWRVYSHNKNKLDTKKIYRKDLSDSLLELLGEITRDIFKKTPQ